MTRTRRLAAAYIALAAAVAVLFALNLFWGSVSLAPGAVLTALLLGGGDATSVECTLDVNGLGLFAKPEKLLNERLEMLRQTLGA